MTSFKTLALIVLCAFNSGFYFGQDFIEDFTNLDWFLNNNIKKIEIQENDSALSDIRRIILFNPEDSIQCYQEVNKSDGAVRGEMKLKFDRFGKFMELKDDTPVPNRYHFDDAGRIISINGNILLQYEDDQERLLKKETEYSNDLYRTKRVTSFSYDSLLSTNKKEKHLDVFSGVGDKELIYQSTSNFSYNDLGQLTSEIVRMQDQTRDIMYRHEYLYGDKELVSSISTYKDSNFSITLFFKYSFH